MMMVPVTAMPRRRPNRGCPEITLVVGAAVLDDVEDRDDRHRPEDKGQRPVHASGETATGWGSSGLKMVSDGVDRAGADIAEHHA